MRNLFLMREKLKMKVSKPGLSNEDAIKELETKLLETEKKIADIIAESNYKIVKENLEYMVDDTEKLNHINMWQLKKKICTKTPEVPTAKKNVNGEIVTEATKLKELYKTTYKTRLQHREMKPELMNMFDKKMELFNIRLKVCKNIKSFNWSEEELLKVLKNLKNNKSADFFGLIYELFKPGVIGTDLLTSLLMFCNKVKNELLIPDMLTVTSITSIYKNKGPKNDLDSDRGIFGACKVRSILDKLIYQDEYEKLDDNLSDSNAGGRKERNIRDNLFVIYAVINEAIKNKKAVEIQFYDLSNCFDSMWAVETMNDIYDAGLKMINLHSLVC